MIFGIAVGDANGLLVTLGDIVATKHLTQNNFSNFVSLKALYTLGRIV